MSKGNYSACGYFEIPKIVIVDSPYLTQRKSLRRKNKTGEATAAEGSETLNKIMPIFLTRNIEKNLREKKILILNSHPRSEHF